MVDTIIKGALAIGAGVAAWYADKYVKETTGKHIHEHAIDFVKSLWNSLKSRASRYLDEHPTILKIYASAANFAAAIKRAMNDGISFVRLKIFGEEYGRQARPVIFEEDVPLDQAYSVQQQIDAAPVLAQRY